MRAPVSYMDSCRLVEPHMAVDAASAIPSAVGLVAVIHTHCHHVLPSIYNIRCKVVAERTISVWSLSEQCAVDPHLCIHIHPVKVDVHHLSLVSIINCECLAIPSDTARQCSAAIARRCRSREVALDSPVVGHIECVPLAVVIIQSRHLHRVGECKSPSFVKVNSLAGSGSASYGHNDQE